METALFESRHPHPFYKTPHSLGKLIEWKQRRVWNENRVVMFLTPHSLGKLIEWKRIVTSIGNYKKFRFSLPTRWGN